MKQEDKMRLKDLLEEKRNLLDELKFITDEIDKIVKKYTRLYDQKSSISKSEIDRKIEFDQIQNMENEKKKLKQREKEFPSEIKRYNKWQEREPDIWHYNDVIGYWLSCYLQHFEIEDTSFMKKKEVYISKIRSLSLDKKINPKDFIDWFFDSLDKELSWITGVNIGTLTSNHVISSYLTKNKRGKGSVKKFQSQEYWEDIDE